MILVTICHQCLLNNNTSYNLVREAGIDDSVPAFTNYEKTIMQRVGQMERIWNMKQKKTGYIALAAVGIVIIAVIVAMVVGNHSGEKQDDVLSTGVTTEKKEDNGENGKGSQKEETNLSSENSNTQNDDLPVVPIEAEEDAGNTGQRADSAINPDEGQDTSDNNTSEGTDSDNQDNEETEGTDSDNQDNEETDDTEPQNTTDTDDRQENAIELPFVPAK